MNASGDYSGEKNGFTLLELSVVLVIIGFIIGAIFVGQSLIRSSAMQSALGEYDAYLKAVNEFKDKFLALPGDMRGVAGYTPEDMWGSDVTCPGTPTTTIPHVPTCNGDYNGKIGTSDFSANLTNTTEWFRAWQQLYDGNFIGTEFTGTPGSGGVQEARPGQNIPGSAVAGGGWTILYYSLINTNASLWGDQYGHVMIFGGFQAGGLNTFPILSASEALAIDMKIDDGNPGTGIVRAWRTAVLPNCTVNDTSQTAQAYASTDSSALVCSLVMVMRF